MIADKNKRSGFTLWEKIAVAVIIVLLIIIIILIFYQDIKNYIEVFNNWYESKV
jgi:cell division protein FtsL